MKSIYPFYLSPSKSIHNALSSSFTLTYHLPFSPCTITHKTPATCRYNTDFFNFFFVSNTIKLAKIMSLEAENATYIRYETVP